MAVQKSSQKLTSGKIAIDAIVAAPVRLSQTGPDFHMCLPEVSRTFAQRGRTDATSLRSGRPERRIHVGSLYH